MLALISTGGNSPIALLPHHLSAQLIMGRVYPDVTRDHHAFSDVTLYGL